MTTIRARAGRAASRSAAQRSAPSTPRRSGLPAAPEVRVPDGSADVRPGTRATIVIERIWPELDGGRHPVKRVSGDDFLVTADIFADGHDLLAAALLVRPESDPEWHEVPMRLIDNDRWSARLHLDRLGRHRYTVEAWRDAWGSLMEALGKKIAAGVPVATELAEAALLLEEARARIPRGRATADRSRIQRALAALRRGGPVERTARSLLGAELMEVIRRHPDRTWATRYPVDLPLMVDRERARFGAWYELFPRSQGRKAGRASTLAEATWRLPELARLGFDVVYLPPIHPVGTVNRKGRNNSLTVGPDDPGSPWAIGSAAGGHTDVAPELGGLDAFLAFREAVEAQGMEVALDLALQAAPDHPYVRSHPEWFRHAPDGTIKYAENPPKKYQDIYPIDFYGPDEDDRVALWEEWLRVVRLWIARGVRIFRVDNPHTKPVSFWGWLIGEVQREHPEVIFLAEAFTRPKMMRVLAKVGFSQSYTYFTWRETRDELRDYLTELTASEMRDYYRGNLFTNTPDINPHHLDHGRPTFVARLVLAATLSSSYGIYSGFELCEADRLEDREEYANSEKYEIRHRDWDAPGNIKPLIGELNRLRREWPALRQYDNLRFEAASGDRVLFYRKALPDGEPDPLSGFPYRWRDPVFVAVNVDPRSTEHGTLHPDLPALGIAWDEPYRLTDLLSGERRLERGADLAVDLTPEAPFRMFTISRIEGPTDR